MTHLRMRVAAALVIALFALLAATESQARGALAVGSCGAWGGAWNYKSDRTARTRALRECNGRDCKVVATMQKLCAAFAHDEEGECGAWGWSTRESQDDADAKALEQCAAAGGADCRVRGQFCDE